MRGSLWLFFLFPVLLQAQQEPPRIIIGIVVDQLRYELIDRMRPSFGDKGFGRLEKEGLSFDSLTYTYVPTYTGPGHATIFTGTTPSEHGIVGNHWYDPYRDRSFYCADDTVSGGDILVSSRNLMAPTFGDRLKMTGKLNQVIGISLKDRGAIFPVGREGDLAIWLDDEGNFTSNSYYPSYTQYKDRLKAFNAPDRINDHLQGLWVPLAPDSVYETHCTPDAVSWEKAILRGRDPSFPYDLKELKQQKGFKGIRYVPAGNTLVFDLAYQLLPEMNVEGETQMLTLGFSAPDYIGHDFGPLSWEVVDTYLRFNEELDKFILYLDSTIGRDHYLMFLTSDHGVADPPGYSRSVGRKAENLYPTSIEEDIRRNTQGSIPFRYYDGGIYVYWDRMADPDSTKIIRDLMNATRTLPYVLEAWSPKSDPLFHNEFSSFFQNGHFEGRSPDIRLIWQKYYIEYGSRGTTHGSPFPYDAHVPGFFLGSGIPSGLHWKNKTPITFLAPFILHKFGESINDWPSQILQMIRSLDQNIEP
ncbi:MAG: alkaline phosphatase family protein [Bacteroidota bacterium]|nr:alkaline phosphatase family protein [Bacteroidota bacterium]MDX5506640.1 alkaline phosphatase family protein [Bacteroidota bacterium]